MVLNTELILNQTFTFRLPPTVIEQARGYADYCENALFLDNDDGGVGNSASFWCEVYFFKYDTV